MRAHHDRHHLSRADRSHPRRRLQLANDCVCLRLFAIFDRDSIFSAQVFATVKSFGIESMRTAHRSPWQNGVAERWVASVRRELLDHVVVFGERHLRRLLREYVDYYHDDRTHPGLDKETPAGRLQSPIASLRAAVVAHPRVGGLHHRYELAA
jgi:hypothetical protein